MPNIVHSTSRPSSPKSKLLIVRQPVKSVHRQEHPERLPLRLAIGCIVGLGVIIGVWLLGHLGYRLGFAPGVRVPDLLSEPGSGLVTGSLMLISVPRLIFQAGLGEPLWLMLGFAMIAVPAASLAAAQPLAPGGPRLRREAAYLASAGAVLALLSAVLLIWWTGSPVRLALVGSLPLDAAAAVGWHEDLQTAAGLDVLAVITAGLWVVLTFRLPIAGWLKAITASATVFTLVVVSVGMSMSCASATQAGRPRSLCTLQGEAGPARILLGSTPHHTATVTVGVDQLVVVELHQRTDGLTVSGRQSLIGYLDDRGGDTSGR